MNRQYIIDNDIVSRYLNDQLSEHERTEFEIFYLDDQETLDEIEVLSAMQRLLAMDDTASEGRAEGSIESAEPAPEPGHSSAQERRTVRTRRLEFAWMWPLATAAALVIGIAIGVSMPSTDGAHPTGKLPGATLIHVELMRGSDQPVFEVPLQQDPVMLQVAVGTAESAYRLSLVGADGQPLHSDALRPDDYGDVGISLQPEMLMPGIYQLQAVGVDSGETALIATLRLVSQTPTP